MYLVTPLTADTSGRGGCHAGYRWHWDCDYPCGGCYNCRAEVRLAWIAGATVFILGGGRERIADALGAFQALANVGRAVFHALNIGYAVAQGLRNIVDSYHAIAIGAHYEVTGRRGSAKQHVGFRGECVWIGPDAYGREFAKMALKNQDGQRIYAACGQVTRIPTPEGVVTFKSQREETLERRKAMPKFPFNKGDIAVIVSGIFKGRTGKIFWIGNKNGIERLGLKDFLDERIGTRQERNIEPMWIDASEALPYQPEIVACRLGHEDFELAERIAVVFAEAGFQSTAEKWITVAASLRP